MRVGYKVAGLHNFYEVMHTWANQEIFKKCGIEMSVVKTPDKDENRTNSSRNQGFFEKIVNLFSKKPDDRMIQSKYNDFIEKYIDSKEESIKGYTFSQMQYIFGKLVIPKEIATETTFELEDESYIPSLILLNQKDYLPFFKAGKEEQSYLFSYMEQDDIHKANYIQNFVNQKGLDLVYIGDQPKYYKEKKKSHKVLEETTEQKKDITVTVKNNAGPIDIISYIFEAKGIITNSLPVLEIAITFGKDFIYLSGGRGEGAAILLLEQLGLGKHFVHDNNVKEKEISFQFKNKKKLRTQLIEARKELQKQLKDLFPLPEIDTDRLDSCECPTGISRSGCYGCLACKEVCPTNAIKMEEDEEGFLYPVTDYYKCIDCGLCGKTCIRNKVSYIPYKESLKKVVCARLIEEDIVAKSTSGAVFPALAKYAIEEKKGVVVGVKYTKLLNVVSDVAQTMEEAEAFYGSKYVKSSYDGIFPRIKTLLRDGRFVLYSGLPCECAGLKSYLRKDYENLLICEILCHSVPSPKVYRKYLTYLEEKRNTKLKKLVFRQKTETYGKMVFTFKSGAPIKVKYWKNNYFRAFSNDYISRTSCSRCDFVYTHRVGDVTIGDFWGVNKVYPELAKLKGISCILMNTKKGEEVITQLEDQFIMKDITIKQAFIKNHRKAKPLPPEREEIFSLLDSTPINELLEKYNDLAVKPEVKIEKTSEEVSEAEDFVVEEEISSEVE